MTLIFTKTDESSQDAANINVFPSAVEGHVALYHNKQDGGSHRALLTVEQSKQIRKALKAAEKKAQA